MNKVIIGAVALLGFGLSALWSAHMFRYSISTLSGNLIAVHDRWNGTVAFCGPDKDAGLKCPAFALLSDAHRLAVEEQIGRIAKRLLKEGPRP